MLVAFTYKIVDYYPEVPMKLKTGNSTIAQITVHKGNFTTVYRLLLGHFLLKIVRLSGFLLYSYLLSSECALSLKTVIISVTQFLTIYV